MLYSRTPLTQTTWTSGTFAVNGIRTHATRTGGDHPALIAVHGRTGDGLTWTRLARLLAPDFDVSMPDLRGHGGSDAPARGWDIPTAAQDIAAVASMLDLPPFMPMGASHGAVIANHLAVTPPTSLPS